MHTNDAQTEHTCQTRSVCKPRPPAYIQGPASISTITSDLRPVFETRPLFEEIRYTHCTPCLKKVKTSHLWLAISFDKSERILVFFWQKCYA